MRFLKDSTICAAEFTENTNSIHRSYLFLKIFMFNEHLFDKILSYMSNKLLQGYTSMFPFIIKPQIRVRFKIFILLAKLYILYSGCVKSV